jgi:hypothetical protein
MGTKKYDNTKLCRRNYRFVDYLAEKSVFPSLLLTILMLIGMFVIGIAELPMIFFEIATVLTFIGVFWFGLSAYYVKNYHIWYINGVIYYRDTYSKVVYTPKNPDSEQLEG